jgi:hypothetical protein
MKHLTEEDLVGLYYREERGRDEAERHLSECEECRAAFAELERSLGTVTEALATMEPGPAFEAETWARLAPQLERRPAGLWSTWFTPQRWALAAAMAGLLVAAFLAGHYWQRPSGSNGSDRLASAKVRERVLLVAVGEHLDQSQMVLMEIMNAGDDTDLSGEQRRAQDLVASNRLYRQAALRSGDRGVASVLDELERVLLEVANSPSGTSGREMEELRRRVANEGLLFKIRVIDSQVRTRATGRSL